MFQLIPLVDNSALKFEFAIYGDGRLSGVVDVGGVDTGYAQTISTPAGWMYVARLFST